MARIFMDGFESGDFGSWTNSTAEIDSSKAGRTGNYCVYSALGRNFSITLITPKSEIYIAEKISISSQGMTNNQLISFYYQTTLLGSLQIVAGRSKLRFFTDVEAAVGTIDLQIATTSIFNLIEIKYIPHISSGTFQLKINGILDIDLTGVKTAVSTSNITSILFGAGSANVYYYTDDVIIDDANWIGPSSIQGLAVTGAGATTQFDPSTGSNYACVDEVPPSDIDYISTNTPNEIDTYACGNLTGTINSVKAVQVQARCMQEGSPAVPKIQLVTRPSSTDRVSASKDVQTFQPGTASNIWELNPDDSAAWESADVNGMEIGVKAVAS